MELRGWTVYELRSSLLSVQVVPGKGGDILSARWLPTGEDVLWTSPWGLRERGSLPSAGSRVASLLEAYPGGWQSVFPNGGDPCVEGGVEWGMHGEAWTAPWDVVSAEPDQIVMATRLVRSPFELTKRIVVEEGVLTVTESVHNVGRRSVEVMWSQHPAFGPAVVGPQTRVTTSARRFAVDDSRDAERNDLQPGWVGDWPMATAKTGPPVDVSYLPAESEALERMGYLSEFDGPAWVALSNARNGLEARVSWNAEEFPHAWYWLEAHGTLDFPWFGAVYVLAIEPATSWPGQGIHAARAKTGTPVVFAPDERRETAVTLELTQR